MEQGKYKMFQKYPFTPARCLRLIVTNLLTKRSQVLEKEGKKNPDNFKEIASWKNSIRFYQRTQTGFVIILLCVTNASGDL